MFKNKAKNRNKYIKDNINIYPYANNSKQLYNLIKISLIVEGILLVIEFVRKILQLIFQSLASSPASLSDLDTINFFVNGYNNFVSAYLYANLADASA